MGEATAVLLVLQNPKTGREAEHLDWYATTHLPDVCAIPGVRRGEFTAATAAEPAPRWSNAAVYRLATDSTAFLDELFGRARSGQWVLSDTLDDTTLMLIGEALTGRVCAPGTPDTSGRDRALYVALTNAVDGEDVAFNTWYDAVHLPDVLAVPGFVAAQRFRLLDHPALPTPAWRYLALYEMRADAADAAPAELSARVEAGTIPVSATLADDASAVAFVPQAVLQPAWPASASSVPSRRTAGLDLPHTPGGSSPA